MSPPPGFVVRGCRRAFFGDWRSRRDGRLDAGCLIIRQLLRNAGKLSWKTARAAGRHTREYLTTAEIELHVHRAKNGSPSVHPMQGDEIRALRRLQREQGPSSHVFMTERDGPMTPKAFHALFGRIGAW